MNKPEKLSRKELARQFRHAAYQRAKEFRKTDPRQIAIKERLKEQQKEFQRDAYQKAKKRNKAYRDGIKKASDERAVERNSPSTHSTGIRIRPSGKAVRQNKLMRMVVRGSAIKGRGF